MTRTTNKQPKKKQEKSMEAALWESCNKLVRLMKFVCAYHGNQKINYFFPNSHSYVKLQ